MNLLDLFLGLLDPCYKVCWKCGHKWRTTSWSDMPDDADEDRCPKCGEKN